MRRPVLAVLGFLLLARCTAAETYDATTLRLATIAKVWGAVKYAHPSMGHRDDLDWDAAGVRAAERARGSDAVADIVAEMLAAVGDRMTRVTAACVEGSSDALPPEAWRKVADGMVYIPLSVLAQGTLDPELAGALGQATHVILDLRTPPGRCSTPALTLLPQIEKMVIKGSLPLPEQRKIRHRGYRTQEPNAQSVYSSNFESVMAAVAGSPNGTEAEALFLADERTSLPPFAVAMILARRGWIVASGGFGEEAAVPHVRVPLGDGWDAVVRTAHYRVERKSWHIGAAALLPAGASTERMIAAAVDMTRPRKRRGSRSPSGTESLPVAYTWRADERYAAMHYPPFEYRALAAFRLWNIIHYFYGYPHLIGDWNARLPEVVNLLTNARSQREYDLAIARVMTFVPDGHSWVYSPSFLDLRGRYGAPFFLMPVEGKPVVVELTDPAASGPVALGDELVAMDGRPVAERHAELDPYISGSTDAARAAYITAALPRGPQTDAVYTFRKPDGQTYQTTLRRGSYVRAAPPKAWRVLQNNIGYLDLRWLESSQVNEAMDELMNTRGLVIDIRNYPRGVFQALSGRLQTKGTTVVSEIHVPLVSGGTRSAERVMQSLFPSGASKYTKPTVTLIDERAQSQSEHTCLVLEAMNGTTFVGSPTVGANGNVTYMVLPGSIYVSFTGMDVRHADGRQLQRVGILPHVSVPRTVEMFRQGRDEVLERAVEILSR